MRYYDFKAGYDAGYRDASLGLSYRPIQRYNEYKPLDLTPKYDPIPPLDLTPKYDPIPPLDLTPKYDPIPAYDPFPKKNLWE